MDTPNKTTLKNLSGSTFNYWTVLNDCINKITPSGQTKTHWLCVCKCGTTKYVYQNSLTSNKSKSCGCIKQLLKYEDTMNNEIYITYKSKAKRKGIIFELTKEEFKKLTDTSCFYCGTSPSNVHSRGYRNKRQGEYFYNGVDRVDNNLGYLKTNVVTSCKNCNLAKRALTQSQFFEMIKLIYERQKLNEK